MRNDSQGEEGALNLGATFMMKRSAERLSTDPVDLQPC